MPKWLSDQPGGFIKFSVAAIVRHRRKFTGIGLSPFASWSSHGRYAKEILNSIGVVRQQLNYSMD
jgi:hypothetical protein